MSDRRYVVVEDSTVDISERDLESLPDVAVRGEVWEMTTREPFNDTLWW